MACCCKGFPPFANTRCYFDGSAQRVATFDSAQLTANPNNFAIANIPNMVNANYSGLAACTLQVVPAGGDNGMVFDFFYTIPWDRVMAVRITTNYGNILNDGDNIFNPDAQLFDAGGAPLTPVFVAAAANGGGFFVTPVPGAPVDGVARLRLTNIRGNLGGGPATVGIREVELMVQGIGPAALVYCPEEGNPVSWVDPRNGAAISFADLTTCR